jgi:hypothetical protein
LKNTDITESWGRGLDGILGILAFVARLLMVGLIVAMLYLCTQ